MIVDEWKGLAIYSSDDALTWKRQPRRILDTPGKGKDDGVIGHHADVVVSVDRAFVFYFTHPGRTRGNEKKDGVEQRRSSIHVVELELADGEIRCERDKPTRVKLDPTTTR